MKHIVICADCGDPFCAICDEPEHCADCRIPICPECFDIALDLRQCRCMTCFDGDLTQVRYRYPEGREMDKRYTRVREGKLPCD